MKTRILLTLLTIVVFPVFFLSSCSKIKDLTAFDVTYNVPRTTFTYTPTTNKSGEQILYAGYVSANLDSILNANNISTSAIENATFTKCSITIEKPDNVTFSWLHSARAEISENAGSTPAEVGNVTVADPNAKTVNFVLNNTNIRPYLGGKSFYFRILGVLNGPVPSDWVQMYMDGTLLLHVQPI
jgi:hypothetical protein